MGRRWLAGCLIPLLVTGCSLDLGPLTQAESISSERGGSSDQHPIRLMVDDEEKTVQQASLLTPEGKRVDMTRNTYISSWNELLAGPWESSFQSSHDVNREYPLTWVLRIRGEEPVLFRLGKDGAYWRGKRYHGNTAGALYQASMQVLAAERLDEISRGSSFRLVARDTRQQTDWFDREADEWLRKISDAQYQSFNPAKVEGLSLFPSYEWVVRGLDRPASVRLVDERRFLLVYGAETYLFAAENSGYRQAEEHLVPRSPPSHDILSLLEEKLVETTWAENGKRNRYPSSPAAEQSVRQWIRKTAACEEDKGSHVGKEPLLTLYFQRAEKVRPVEIFENGYRLNGGAVIPCSGIDRRARSLVENG
ncbi:hypothetical protein [Desmospora profundinema]|uniref:Uncharacterized protein n=1 Tax=Desmospora profundinema TaxID=1571184 RepID=A0ABU1IHC4_9BACL|nr:hypothetical protein [Desmospora profundinema]MDR6224179.1 hypothetical protein [Desmospora profundinema]